MRKVLNSINPDWFRKRIIGSAIIVIVVFSILGIRLFFLQVVEGEKYRSSSENQKIRKQTIDPQRGLIFDRSGVMLVDNRPSFDLSIVRKDASPVKQTIQRLAGYIHVPVEKLMGRIRAKRRVSSFTPITILQDIERNILAVVEVRGYELPGIGVEIRSKRNYIYGEFAAHLLGYLGEINLREIKSGKYPGSHVGDYIGKYGIEKKYNSYLVGKRGGRLVEVNAKGRVVKTLKTVNAVSGNNIFLTIDFSLQKRAEELLQKHAGGIVAMNPDTGEVLALASSPSYNPNSFVGGISKKEWRAILKNTRRPLENKVISGQYPPASTYKIVTAIAGLNEGVINDNTRFFCPGFLQFGDRKFRCWKKWGHGSMDVVRALAESCDVFFYHVGQKLGVDKLARYANFCGLGKKTGIDLGQEVDGLIPSSSWKKRVKGKNWQRGETLPVAIGQGYNLVTPLQMCVLTSALANGGTLFQPFVVSRIVSPSGEIVLEKKATPKERLPFSKHVLNLIQKGMWSAVNASGTAGVARVAGVNVYGKTGTAQIIGRKTDDPVDKKKKKLHLTPHAWFISYATGRNKKIALAVIVEHGEHGSGTAAPIARDLIETYFGQTENKRDGN